jgi:hypothetical protein
MGTIQAQRFCPHCNRLVLATRRTPNHILHLLLTVLLLGFWLIVWLLIAITSHEPYLCQNCGTLTLRTREASGQRRPMSTASKVVLSLVTFIIIAVLTLAWFITEPGAQFGCTLEQSRDPFSRCFLPSAVDR